jgi:hypothetical protein
VTRYHSLVIAPRSLPDVLRVLATSDDDGAIMAVEHRTLPIVGVQFHPESAASEHGYAMLDRFMHGSRAREKTLPNRADGAYKPEEPERAEHAFKPPPVALLKGA